MKTEHNSEPIVPKASISRRSFLGVAAAGAMSLVLAGCGTPRNQLNESASSSDVSASASSSSSESSASSAAASASTSGKAIVACFSYDGHTWAMANRIGKLAGIDPRRIEAVDPYPDSATGDQIKGYDSAGYDETVDIAKEEQSDNAMPAYTVNVDGWNDCETVFLGYPIWWGDTPQIVKNFVSKQDWEGKTVVPFSSNQGSGWGRSLSTLEDLCNGAKFVNGIALRGDEVESSLGDIDEWYAGLGL